MVAGEGRKVGWLIAKAIFLVFSNGVVVSVFPRIFIWENERAKFRDKWIVGFPRSRGIF